MSEESIEEAFARRRAFARFSDADAQALSELGEIFDERADGVVDRFYAHILEHPSTRVFLGDPAVIERLRVLQAGYLRSLASGRYDAEYANRRAEIGRAHERIGLDPEWYVGTYGLYLTLLFPLVRERFSDDPGRAVDTCAALAKLMLLDVQFALDAYYDTRQKKIVDRSRQLAEIGELAASIAHEVRNPLAGMKGALNMLHAELSSKQSNREIADELLAQIGRLENLVRDLLSYARPRIPKAHEFDLHRLLQRLVRSHRPESRSAGVTVELRLGPGTSHLTADEAQVEQALLNLLQNALQAMDQGGALTVVTEAGEGSLAIEFRDTGRGISDQDMPQVLKPFFTTRHRGSGLGLPIVNGIVEAHDGTLTIRSKPGRGTTVRMALPQRS